MSISARPRKSMCRTTPIPRPQVRICRTSPPGAFTPSPSSRSCRSTTWKRAVFWCSTTARRAARSWWQASRSSRFATIRGSFWRRTLEWIAGSPSPPGLASTSSTRSTRSALFGSSRHTGASITTRRASTEGPHGQRGMTRPLSPVGGRGAFARGSPLLLIEHAPDRPEHRILVGGGGRGGGGAGQPEVLLHATVLLPSPQLVVEIYLLPLGMPVLHEPIHPPRHELGEATDIVAIAEAVVEGDQHGLHGHRGQLLGLPRIRVARDLRGGIDLHDALARDGNQGEL